MESYALTDVGRVRAMNQDYIYASPEPVGTLPNLFLVADGMGGHRAGDYASRYMVERSIDREGREHMKRYPHIFKPFRCKSLELKNRIVMMPMGTNYGEQTGEMSFLHIHYYEMRAKGGTGFIIMENVCVDYPCGSNGTTQLRMDQDN